MSELTTALRLISEHPELSDFVGPRPEALVAAVERFLDVRFPPTYRTFLLELGAGSFGSIEVFGVVDEEWEDSGIPDVVWLTRHGQKEAGLPHQIVPVHDDGMGNWLVLNLREPRVAEEPEVAAWHVGGSRLGVDLEVVASDFGHFLLEKVEGVLRRSRPTA